MLVKWALRQGDAWDYRSNGTPYWLLCVVCHMRRWPNDRRYRNANSRPAPPWLHIQMSGRRCLVAGDLWITSPPPESEDRMLGGPRVVRPRFEGDLIGETAEAEAAAFVAEREEMSMARADAEAAAFVLADRGAQAVAEARLRMLEEVRSTLSASSGGSRLLADSHVQWLEPPVSDVVTIPRDQLPRCLFAYENGSAPCCLRGCRNFATGFFKVRRLQDSLHTDLSFLCHDCGGLANRANRVSPDSYVGRSVSVDLTDMGELCCRVLS